VTITGKGFGNNITDILDVSLSGVSCRETLIYFNSSLIQCTSLPAASLNALSGNVVVETIQGGAGVSPPDVEFVYNPGIPFLSSGTEI